MDSVFFGLLVVQGGDEVLEEEVDVINGGTGRGSQLHEREDGISKGVTVDFSQHSLGVLVLHLSHCA
jgi:hypothetical protein